MNPQIAPIPLGRIFTIVASVIQEASQMNFKNPDFPLAFHQADKFSLDGQRRTLAGTSTRLVLAIVATLCLALAPLWPTELFEHREIELVGIVAALLFLLALLIELRLLRQRPERAWYDGRALAESAKTLSWRYAVGGAPYPIVLGAAAVDDAYRRDIQNLATDLMALESAVASGEEPTNWMRDLRVSELPVRQTAYLHHRVRDQEEWYARKATFNIRRARMWVATLLVAEAAGVILALLKSTSVVPVDLACVAAAVIASGVAWTALKQHESVGAAYTLASRELASVHVRLLEIESEEQWAQEVASAEGAISREHTMWRASRLTVPQPD
ncbi:DUF4231 domain-containing protein [Nocardia sp. CA-135953]|uniref:DUF4231 domain-containing protein n=1 Tax=Nocardia sp. CA-135953 TaxID=3239978 RepID=UPI003D96EAEC